ncbi:hypothetical protein [Hirschia litorea]|uniref:Uncharacterized protein n=1 Tax=Hirschia litorea TaxID=1199156 RepID=A0ABW2ILI8_9PROT
MKSPHFPILRTSLMIATMLTIPAFSAFAEDSKANPQTCETSLEEGSFQANISIGEYYPGSELHRQTVTITATPAEVLNDPPSIKTPLKKYIATLSMTSKSSLKNKQLLKKGEYEKLGFSLTLPLLGNKMWYHNTCLAETPNYVLLDNVKIDGDYANTCDLTLHDAHRKVLNKEDYLDYSFSGHEHWEPFKLRINLAKLRAFSDLVDKKSTQQIADFAAGKCSLKPFAASS